MERANHQACKLGHYRIALHKLPVSQIPSSDGSLSAPIDMRHVRRVFSHPTRVAESDFLRREIAQRMHERLALIKIQPRQVLDVVGDWSARRPLVRPGGWAFQYANPHYPDLDDTAVVVMAMDRARRLGAGARYDEAIARAVEWVKGLQSSDGGWAAFDVDNMYHYLNNIPFADHGALIDPPTEDVAARCVSMLAQLSWAADGCLSALTTISLAGNAPDNYFQAVKTLLRNLFGERGRLLVRSSNNQRFVSAGCNQLCDSFRTSLIAGLWPRHARDAEAILRVGPEWRRLHHLAGVGGRPEATGLGPGSQHDQLDGADR